MSDAAAARAWLEARIPAAPPALRTRATEAIDSLHGDAATGPIPVLLTRAAESCLRETLVNPSERSAALPLLAADALLTHACQAAAEQGIDALETFTAGWGPEWLAGIGSAKETA